MLSQTSPMPLLIATLPLANRDHCMCRLLSVSVFAGSLSLSLSLFLPLPFPFFSHWPADMATARARAYDDDGAPCFTGNGGSRQFLATASDWKDTSTYIQHHTELFPDLGAAGTEDQFIYMDDDGYYHAVFHHMYGTSDNRDDSPMTHPLWVLGSLEGSDGLHRPA